MPAEVHTPPESPNTPAASGIIRQVTGRYAVYDRTDNFGRIGLDFCDDGFKPSWDTKIDQFGLFLLVAVGTRRES